MDTTYSTREYSRKCSSPAAFPVRSIEKFTFNEKTMCVKLSDLSYVFRDV
jgi:hypothetical protein